MNPTSPAAADHLHLADSELAGLLPGEVPGEWVLRFSAASVARGGSWGWRRGLQLSLADAFCEGDPADALGRITEGWLRPAGAAALRHWPLRQVWAGPLQLDLLTGRGQPLCIRAQGLGLLDEGDAWQATLAC